MMSVGVAMVVAGIAGITDSTGKHLHDGVAFLVVGGVSMVIGLVVSRYYRMVRRLSSRDAMALVTSVWVTMIVVSTVGFVVSGELRVADALFESASGFTTTGMTVLADPSQASTALLTWRAMTQWMAGYGIMVVGFGVLPLFGGAYRMRAGQGRPGPSGTLGDKFDEVARRIGVIYLGFTIAMFVAYVLAGVESFDAMVLSFTTVSTGGFTNQAGSFRAYDNAAIEWVAIVGMLLAGTSVAIWWWALSGSTKRALKSVQLRSYLGLILLVSLVTAAINGGDADGIRRSIFTVVSYSTTTGFEVVDAGAWHPFLDALLFSLMVIGSMSGSAGGGLHISRIRLLLLYLRRVLTHQVHPAATMHVKANGKKVDEYVINNTVGSAALYISLALVGSLGVATFGSSLHLSFIAAISALSNVGPVFGVDACRPEAVSCFENVRGLSGFSRFVLAGLMIAGRLGVYPALVALGDAFAPVYARLVWASHFLTRRKVDPWR